MFVKLEVLNKSVYILQQQELVYLNFIKSAISLIRLKSHKIITRKWTQQHLTLLGQQR